MKYFFNKIMGREDKGVAAVEFALLLPFMLIMFVGLFDVSNYIFCVNKMNRTVQNLNNIVTRGDVTKPQLDSLLQAATLIAQPFNFPQSGNAIVTSVSHPDPDPTKPSQVMWRNSYPGGTGGSRISAGSLPGGLTLNPNETVIFTEVFFNFQPLFPTWNLIPGASTSIYAVAAGVPRQGTMATLPPG